MNNAATTSGAAPSAPETNLSLEDRIIGLTAVLGEAFERIHSLEDRADDLERVRVGMDGKIGSLERELAQAKLA